MYGLRAPDTRRQYHRRFQYFLDFLRIPGTLEEQARQFVLKARENEQWAQESLMSFIDFKSNFTGLDADLVWYHNSSSSYRMDST
jgi:hypothetical protein